MPAIPSYQVYLRVPREPVTAPLADLAVAERVAAEMAKATHKPCDVHYELDPFGAALWASDQQKEYEPTLEARYKALMDDIFDQEARLDKVIVRNQKHHPTLRDLGDMLVVQAQIAALLSYLEAPK